MKLTKQGVRDLGNNSRARKSRVIVTCPHVWELVHEFDYWTDTVRVYERCGFCKETR